MKIPHSSHYCNGVRQRKGHGGSPAGMRAFAGGCLSQETGRAAEAGAFWQGEARGEVFADLLQRLFSFPDIILGGRTMKKKITALLLVLALAAAMCVTAAAGNSVTVRVEGVDGNVVCAAVDIGEQSTVLEVLEKALTAAGVEYVVKDSAYGGKYVSAIGEDAESRFGGYDGWMYYVDGVSPMQKLQMTTQEGNNVSVCAIEGNFDDAQSGVKSIFTNREIEKKFTENHLAFSSANSINWGRLVPQIVYYVSAYCDMVKSERLKLGAPMNVVVPTGNFGNILAAYYAKQMGVPIGKLICASNANNVLTDFLTTGTYNKNRPFYCTTSPSMDILISSNLERLLFALSGQDAEQTKALMEQLAANGTYTVSEKIQKSISELFAAGYCDDADTKRTIRKIFDEYNYLCDMRHIK